MNFVRLLASVCLFLGLFSNARAHVIDAVEFEFQADAQEWRLLGEIDIAFMLPEMRGVPGGLPVSRSETMKAPPEELARIRKETEHTLRKLLRLTYAGKNLAWTIRFPDFDKEPFELPIDAGDAGLISVRIITPALPGPGELEAHWTDEFDSEFIAVNDEAGESVVTASSGRSTVLLRVEKGAEPVVAKTSIGEWIFSGFDHVVPRGWDHELFIIGLFLLLPRWKPLMLQSLVFTLAHSLTLALSVLGWVRLPEHPVQIAIAVSIAWIGIENLWLKKPGKSRLAVVFAFGLVHGLSFASVFSGKFEGVQRSGFTIPLLGFNLGVELAQISLLALAFLLIWPVRQWTRQIQIGGSVLVALAGRGWLIKGIFNA